MSLRRLRLFAAIDLSDRVRTQCASIIERLKATGFDARFEPAEKLHVTLAFLGWVDAERVDEITTTLKTIAQKAQAFDLTLDKIGAFPHERRPRVIWIGAHEQGAAFRNLARNVRTAYETLGFEFGNDAVAHVTIARVKGGNAHLPSLDLSPMRLDVKELALFESFPAGRTSRYEVRARYPLKSHA